MFAVADYFQDKVDAVGNKFGVPPAQRYPGLSGYQRMLEGLALEQEFLLLRRQWFRL